MKEMILIALACAILCPLNASAKSAKDQPIPAPSAGEAPTNAQFIFQLDSADNLTGEGDTYEVGYQYVLNFLRNWVSLRETIRKDDFNCRVLHHVWSFRYEYQWARGNVDVYCEPRTLQEMQILSLQQTCKQSPQPSCFQKEFLDYISKVQPTQYVEHYPKTKK